MGHRVTFFKRSDLKEPVWQIRIKHNGRYVVMSTGTISMGQAVEIAKEIIEKLVNEENGTLPSPSFLDAWHQFDRETYGAYGKLFDAGLSGCYAFLKANGVDCNLSSMAEQDLNAIVVGLAKGCSYATYANRVRVMREFFHYAKVKRWLRCRVPSKFPLRQIYRKNGLSGNAMPRGRRAVETRHAKSFSADEIKLLLDTCERWIADPPQWGSAVWEELQFYILFLLFTGLRPGKETGSLRWRDISLEELVIKVTDGKTSSPERPRFVVAGEPLRAILRERHRACAAKPDDPVFSKTHFIREFRYLVAHSGIDRSVRRTLYSLRHTYCTNALISGRVSPYVLAKNVGNSVRVIERVYDHSIPLQFKVALREAVGCVGAN